MVQNLKGQNISSETLKNGHWWYPLSNSLSMFAKILFPVELIGELKVISNWKKNQITEIEKKNMKNKVNRCVKKDIQFQCQNKNAFLHHKTIIWSVFNDTNILKVIWGQMNRFFVLNFVKYHKLTTNSVLNINLE